MLNLVPTQETAYAEIVALAELQERIARTDEQIDDTVFALYGLSEDEIKTVRAASN